MRRRPVHLKRAYEASADADGMRVLVDRLWPRGVSRQRLNADLWLRDAAPSDRLRRWYGHDARRWPEFRRKYRRELARQPGVLDVLDDLRRHSALTLVFGARDAEHSHAAVLREVLDERR
jgi:uncharacterized protein YeaO (DUF488 family)